MHHMMPVQRTTEGLPEQGPCAAQVHKRKAAARASALQQPMLSAVYKEPPAWTLSRLVRGAAITLVSGAIAGAWPLSFTHAH